MNFSKKHTVIPLSFLLICIMVRGLLLYSMSIAPFAGFCKELAIESLTDNPFELHYTVAYPEKLGLSDLSHNLLPFRKDAYMQSETIWQERSARLDALSKERLRAEDTFLYELLSNYISLQLKSYEFPYYENPLSCNNGVHSQLPILLAEYDFRNADDVENYLFLLSQIPPYLEGIADYAALQEQNGIYLYKGSLTKVSEQCLKLFPADALKAGTHFLQSSFHEKLQKLVSRQVISAAEQSAYEERNNALLLGQIRPAYEALSAAVSQLKGCDSMNGLASYPKGKDYYALLLASNTGSAKSVTEIQDMLYERYDMLYRQYSELYAKETVIEGWDFPFEEPSEMLTHLHQMSQQSFPPLSTLCDGSAQTVQLKKVNGILADMSAPAFYMTPPIDANEEHSIYINPAAEMDSLNLYTTLAHEGFPGHLYQTVYSQNALDAAHAPLLRHLLYYGGFTEGWAVYAELYSYDFLKEACSPESADTLQLHRLNREIQLCLCSILDLYIHYDGSDLSDVSKLLKSLGLNHASADVIYAVICDAPANYPKYYVGYLEILSLKEQAKTLWGDTYTDYAFHQWLLESGAADFSTLEHKLQRE